MASLAMAGKNQFQKTINRWPQFAIVLGGALTFIWILVLISMSLHLLKLL